MLPIGILAPTKVSELLLAGNALAAQIQALNAENSIAVPVIGPTQICLSSAGPELSDRNEGLLYPRICIYCSAVRNTQLEKFCSFSGIVSVVIDIWASADLVQQADIWVQYYVEGVTSILKDTVGDMGDGIFFSGAYDILLEQPKTGGLGFVTNAKIACTLNVTQH